MEQTNDNPNMVDGRSSTEAARRPQRHANVYDAIAGEITYETSLSSASNSGNTPAVPSRPPKMTRHSVHTTTLAPEEVLFRRKAAPERFAEFDVYMAHDRNLPDGGRESLPDPDLLKAVHSYTSHFYSALGGQKRSAVYQVGARNVNERSMDESALLAFGILLEEAGREVLGSKGDMVFTEGLDVSAEPTSETHSAEDGPGQTLTGNLARRPATVAFTDPGSWKRAPKRRKMTDPDDV